MSNKSRDDPEKYERLAKSALERGDMAALREYAGVMLRDLEVIISNYESNGYRSRNEGDAALFTEWNDRRRALFDMLSDLTALVTKLQSEAATERQRAERAEASAFMLSPEEEAQIEEWKKRLPSVDPGTVGGRFSYQFTPTSIGTIVSVNDCVTGETFALEFNA